jgi:hypothetical protein
VHRDFVEPHTSVEIEHADGRTDGHCQRAPDSTRS